MSMLKDDTFIWFDGELKKFSECNISLTTHALHYATSIFEGCRAYNGTIFKNKEHCQRLINSGKMVDVEVQYSVEELMEASNQVLKANNLTDAYVRPVAWKGDETLGVESNGCKTHVAIMAWFWGNYFGEDKINKGLNLAHADWVRPDPRSCAVQAKVAGNYYLGAVMHNKANKEHYDDVLLVINAVRAFIATDDKGYPPVIGVIKKKMREISQPVAMTEFEAWNYIKKAVSNSLYNSKEEYDKLPPTIQSLVGSHDVLREWALIDTSKFDTVVQSNFMRSYKARCEREKEIMALPLSVREFSNKIASTMRMDRLLE